MEFDSLTAFLLWVATGGGAMTLWGYLEAYLLENVAGWHTLPRWLKVVIPIVIAGLLGIAAQALVAADVLWYVPPVLQVLILAGINWLASQKAYLGLKGTAYARSAMPGPKG